MTTQIYLVMRRAYRWTKRGNLIVPCADPVIGVWADPAKANAHARALAASELEEYREGFTIKEERHPQLGSTRLFILLDNRPRVVYDILTYEIR